MFFPNFMDFLNALPTFIGIAAFIPMLVQLGKAVKIVKDGASQKWHEGLQLLFVGGLWLVGTFLPNFDLGIVDTLAGNLAGVGLAIIPLIPTAFAIGKKVYDWVRGGILGLSFSLRKASA